MKKFFIVIMAVFTTIIISVFSNYLFKGLTAAAVDGVLFIISLFIYQSKWKKATYEKECEELMRITKTIQATSVAEVNALIEKESINWHDIATITINRSYCSHLSDIFKEKQLPALITLITISDLKKQIVWGPNLVNALENLNFIAGRVYDDEVLKKLAKILHDIQPVIQEKENYEGAHKLIKLIETKAPVLCDLII